MAKVYVKETIERTIDNDKLQVIEVSPTKIEPLKYVVWR